MGAPAGIEAMQYPRDLESGRIVRRLGRFTVEVEMKGSLLTAHVANSGRIEELLAPGTPALLRRAQAPGRATHYDLVLVQVAGGWVSADARVPTALVREALEAGRIESLRAFPEISAEVRLDGSRIDFLLGGPSGRCFLEVKSVTLVKDGTALFPDCRTVRGARQLGLLSRARAEGDAAAVLFVVQREDVTCLQPNDAVDPAFATALREAAAAGVRLLAYRCRVSPCAIDLAGAIPVVL